MSARVRPSAGATGAVMLWVHDTNNGNAVQFGPLVASSTEWETYSVNFQSTPTAAVRFHIIYNGAGTGASYVDDVAVEKGWYSGFEEGGFLSGWNGFGSTALSIASAIVLEAAGEGTKMADHLSPIFRPSLSLFSDRLRTVLAVKGTLRRAQQRRALDGSGPFRTILLRRGKGSLRTAPLIHYGSRGQRPRRGLPYPSGWGGGRIVGCGRARRGGAA